MTAPNLFGPSWRRVGIAASLAVGAFFLPQEIPLVWYPLNDPGDEILYLEIRCAADQGGEVQIFYNTTRGINQVEMFHWPISATTRAFTYIFPLPDAPVTELRIDPVANGGALTVTSFRLVDRRGAEVRRFTRQDIVPVQQIAGVEPLAEGWKLISTPGSNDPFANVRLPAPVIAKDINDRNLRRCLLSGGYLALMLWILMVAVLFVFHRPAGWRDAARHLAFMAALALMFSAVGNRGLIKNSARYARFVPPPTPPGTSLEIDLATDHPVAAQLFWNAGRGITETDSARAAYEPHTALQTLRFPLPPGPFHAVRFDPLDGEARFTIRGVRLVDAARRTLALLPLPSLTPEQGITRFDVTDDEIAVATTPGHKDPILRFSPDAVRTINEAIAAPRP